MDAIFGGQSQTRDVHEHKVSFSGTSKHIALKLLTNPPIANQTQVARETEASLYLTDGIAAGEPHGW